MLDERIKKIRTALNLNQTDFGKKIGVKQTTISGYVNGVRQPLDTVIASICRVFSVNEEWLRTGKGEMFVTLNEEDEYMRAATEISTSGDEFAMRAIIEYWKLDEGSKQLFRDFLSRIATKKE